jgi:hypothetical protein
VLVDLAVVVHQTVKVELPQIREKQEDLQLNHRNHNLQVHFSMEILEVEVLIALAAAVVAVQEL